MADIFISYAREDRSRIEPLAKSLEDLGWSVFWDRTIPTGKTWHRFIGDALKSARSVIVAWSQESIESDWVREEAESGRRRGILIPILIDDVDPPLGFGAIQAANLVNWNSAESSPEFEKLISDISLILGPPPKHAKEAKQAEEEERKRRQEEENKRKEEDRRKAEEESQKLEIEKRRIAEERQKRAEAERKAEEQRKRKEIEAKRKAEEERRRKEAQVEAEQAAEEERKREEKDAAKQEAKIAEAEPSEPKPDRGEAPRKSQASRIGLLIALVVVIAVGAVLLFRQEPSKPKTEISASQIKPEVQQKTTDLTVEAGKADVPASETRAAAPPIKMEPQVATRPKPSEASPEKIVTNSIGMKFVLIPAGSFTMGSNTGYKDEKPPQNVRISQSFYLQTTEVTQGQWKKVMGDNPSVSKQCGDDCPVESVSWQDAQAFTKKLNQLEKTNAYRLPSEAEWEYACRSGTATEYSFGDDEKKLGEYAWYIGNSKNETHRVATRKPNAWGLYDMHGNVWEWVEDDYHGSYEGAPNDGRAWVDNPRGSDRVIRGGGWVSDARFCRSASRDGDGPGLRRFRRVGFRLSRSVSLGP